MPLFLDSPRYELGILGFFTDPVFGRRLYQCGGIASLVVLLLAAGISLAGGHDSSVPGQMLFLIVAAWLGVFGFFRLFATGAMWALTAVVSRIEDAIPSFAGPLHFLLRAYWIFFELLLTTGFFGLVVAAGSIPFAGSSL